LKYYAVDDDHILARSKLCTNLRNADSLNRSSTIVVVCLITKDDQTTVVQVDYHCDDLRRTLACLIMALEHWTSRGLRTTAMAGGGRGHPSRRRAAVRRRDLLPQAYSLVLRLLLEWRR